MEIEPWDVDAHILLSSYLYPIDGARRSLLLALITSCIRQPAEDNRSIDPRTCGRVRLRSCATEELPRDRVQRTCPWPVVFCVEESGRFSSFRSQAEVRLAHVASAWARKFCPTRVQEASLLIRLDCPYIHYSPRLFSPSQSRLPWFAFTVWAAVEQKTFRRMGIHGRQSGQLFKATSDQDNI